MTNEIKLLLALCKALGFEVETTLDYQERKENMQVAMKYNSAWPPQRTDRRILASSGPHNQLDIDKDGLYTSLLIDPVVDYKLHKRED